MGDAQRLKGEIIQLKGNIYDLTAALDILAEKLSEYEKDLSKLNLALGLPIIQQTKTENRDLINGLI